MDGSGLERFGSAALAEGWYTHSLCPQNYEIYFIQTHAKTKRNRWGVMRFGE